MKVSLNMDYYFWKHATRTEKINTEIVRNRFGKKYKSCITQPVFRGEWSPVVAQGTTANWCNLVSAYENSNWIHLMIPRVTNSLPLRNRNFSCSSKMSIDDLEFVACHVFFLSSKKKRSFLKTEVLKSPETLWNDF